MDLPLRNFTPGRSTPIPQREVPREAAAQLLPCGRASVSPPAGFLGTGCVQLTARLWKGSGYKTTPGGHLEAFGPF